MRLNKLRKTLGASIIILSPVYCLADYIGDYCWDITGFDAANAKLELAVHAYGNSHYLVHGVMTQLPAPENALPIHGNAELVGSQIKMTLDWSGWNTEDVWQETIQVRLDAQTLSGNFAAVDAWHDLSGGDNGVDITQGSVTFASCK